MKKMICAANWKLNKDPKESEEFLVEFLKKVSPEDQKQFIFFPPAINLVTTGQVLRESSVGWGAQNVYCETSGAFTGENSPQVVADLGATHILIGHSERRSLFSEADELFSKKVKVVQDLDLIPMLCVGETLEQRESGCTQQVISDQLKKGLAQADLTKPFMVAYEPVWAIGTGKVATPEMAEEAHKSLRTVLTELTGATAATTPILYGGSVKPENAGELSRQENIDGFLVGGASLKVESFVGIFTASQG